MILKSMETERSALKAQSRIMFGSPSKKLRTPDVACRATNNQTANISDSAMDAIIETAH